MKQYKTELRKISNLIPYINNSRIHGENQIKQIAASIREFGFTNPLLIDSSNNVIAGHGRLKACELLDINEVPCIVLTGLTDAQKKALVIADNKIAENSSWDEDVLKLEIETIKELDFDFDIDLLGFDADELNDLDLNSDNDLDEEKADDVPELVDEPIIKLGDLIELGESYQHRVLCGDSTSKDDISNLMNGNLADLVFTDPPYGMKKDDIENDNLSYSNLLIVNKKWIPLSFDTLKSNGSWYCWGIDQPLMDIYGEILKPMIANQKITFRNLITWDKGCGQGQNSENTRSYAIADEKCLFVMCGVQGFNNNADNYFKGWDSIVEYLKTEKNKAGLTIKDCKRIAGHSENSGCHWFDKSQFQMPTEETYNSWREHCKTKNKNSFKKEYEEIKKEYEEIKKEYYSTRAYFNNTHDNFNNVWGFGRHIRDGSEGGHSTPKPIPLCERALLSSSKQHDIVVDFFLGSGSTLISSEKLSRKCYGIELDENYTQVTIQRYVDYTQNYKIKINGIEVNWGEYCEK
tara:strand:- start:1269 stop:2828 length:1560 start_codon:yes stop_codon:yes gene_type:complete